MHVVQDINGVVMARGQVTEDGITLQLAAPSGFSDQGGFYPAESLTFDNVEGVETLRLLCEELVEAYKELTQEVE